MASWDGSSGGGPLQKLWSVPRRAPQVNQRDRTSPFESSKDFQSLLPRSVLGGVLEMGLSKPSQIQADVLIALREDPQSTLIAQSQSGTGKTTAGVMALLSRVDGWKRGPQVICVSPTYEVAKQTMLVARKMGTYCMGITMRIAVSQEEVLPEQTIDEQIIIGTIGKLTSWSLFMDMTHVRMCILDEGDAMFASPTLLMQITEFMSRLPDTCQLMLLSTTFDNAVIEKVGEMAKKPLKKIVMDPGDLSLPNIRQLYVDCEMMTEREVIRKIFSMGWDGKAIIFCESLARARDLKHYIMQSVQGLRVDTLHGRHSRRERDATLAKFKNGFIKVLITTNMLARGFDDMDVGLVINYDLPTLKGDKPDCNSYMHRIGRTGRYGKPGLAINLVGKNTSSVLNEIKEYWGLELEVLDVSHQAELLSLFQNN